MKKFVLLFAALLVGGCGEKTSSEGSDSASGKPMASNESAEPSVDVAQSSSGTVALPLSDADVERLLKEAVDFKSLEERKGLYYRGGQSKSYGGWVKEMYDSGQAEALVRLKDGKRDGLVMFWRENGQKKGEGFYKDGKRHGLCTEWNAGGRKSIEATYKEGKPDGVFTVWHENGQKKAEETWKDGKKIGLDIRYFADGQKWMEATYNKEGELNGPSATWYPNLQKMFEESWKDGKKDGLFLKWHANGQKMYESTYKDGELISEKWWNAKGEEVETREEAEE